MNSNHHHTSARVQVYHGRRKISKQKNVEKPKSCHAVRGDTKKRKACLKENYRFQHAAIKPLIKVAPQTSGVDLECTLQPAHPEIISRHYMHLGEISSQKQNSNNQARPKASPFGGDLEGAGGPTS